MPSKLTRAQIANQAWLFSVFLKFLKYTTIMREQLKLLHSDFRSNWVLKNPSERCSNFSNIRYHMTLQGLLKRTKNSKDKFVVVYEREECDDGVGKEERVRSRKKRRRPTKKVARLAVDQHITIHQKEKAAAAEDSPCSSSGATQRNAAESGGTQLEAPLAHTLTYCVSGLVCHVCKVTVQSEAEAMEHVDGKNHRVQALLSCLKRDRNALVRNKNGVTVSSEYLGAGGTIEMTLRAGVDEVLMITISNGSASDSILFKRCELMKRAQIFHLDDAKGVCDGLNSICLGPLESYQVKLTMSAKHVGVFQTIAVFAFTFTNAPPGEKAQDDFLIVRYLSLHCTDELIEELQPEVAYTPPPRVSAKLEDVEVVEGFPPARSATDYLEKEIRLNAYRVPSSLRSAVNCGIDTDKGRSNPNLRNLLKRGLNAETHNDRFKTLLHIEEIQMEVDIRKYDMVGVTMKKTNRLMVLQVPGLAENRPSVLKGDCLYVRILGSSGKAEGCEYRGHVHDVALEHVHLGFSQRLLDRYIKGMKFSVRFEFGRLPLRTQHRALQLAAENSLDMMLFPTEQTACSVGTIPAANIRFFDQRIESNAEQMEAVRHIVEGSSRPAPYLIFGPPGTGKTITMVEAIKQVVTRNKLCNVLVCAASNSAVDLLTERLLAHIDKAAICQLHAACRDWKFVRKAIKQCSNYDTRTNEFYYSKKADLCKFRVIVCTLITASRLVSANFPACHFTHVFIDEAGQAAEPEALVPLAGILECDLAPDDGLDPVLGGQVVLAGDPKQLGAIIRSPIATKYGLGISLLERLMTSSDVYRRWEASGSDVSSPAYNPSLLTKLVRNYRSHPAILRMPDRMFYDDELQVHADTAVREALCRWTELPAPGFPVVFVGTTAQESREERSPSFFNPTEVALVVSYAQQLLNARGAGVKVKVTGSDIGIISPYRKQVQKIRHALQKKKLSSDIKVGSVEEFQGQERLIIIISTVRTSPDYLAMDIQFKLGFLKNPKRFNVAVTRAKALLIVIGNPYVLSCDEHWNGFLEYCRQNGGYTGVDYDPKADRDEDILQRFAAFNLSDTDTTVSMKSLIEEPMWRRSDD